MKKQVIHGFTTVFGYAAPTSNNSLAFPKVVQKKQADLMRCLQHPNSLPRTVIVILSIEKLIEWPYREFSFAGSLQTI